MTREVTDRLLWREPDLAGIFISGGGINGAMAAIWGCGRNNLAAVGYERSEPTLNGLLNGTLHPVIAHPPQRLASECLVATKDCEDNPGQRPNEQAIPSDIATTGNF